MIEELNSNDMPYLNTLTNEKTGNVFIYTDRTNKFIIHPNYKIKTKSGKAKVVNFITAGRVTDYNEFKLKRYEKIR